MRGRPFQYRLDNLLLVIAGVGLILGAAFGSPARLLLVGTSIGLVLASFALLGYILFELVRAGPPGAYWIAGLPGRWQQRRFERRLGRLRRGHSSQRVLALLGPPTQIAGFGDRIYWSYRVAGHRYTVSLDPRQLIGCCR